MTFKRFIAGASCPQCQQIDKLYIDSQNGQRYRACVSCGFREQMRFENTPREMETRVNKALQGTEERVVKLLDPNPRNH